MKSSNNKIAELYKNFSLAEGSQHIASEYAILKLQELIRKFKINNILEIGLGIGSISGILLALNKNLKYSGTENNEFCLKALAENLKKDFTCLHIFQNLNKVSAREKFDLIIIDAKDSNPEKIKKLIEQRGIICIEGDRIPQQTIITEFFPKHKIVHSISLKKNKSYSPFPEDEWQGGLKVVFINPDLKQYLWWLKEKIKTKLKYQYPGRHFGKAVSNLPFADSRSSIKPESPANGSSSIEPSSPSGRRSRDV